MPPLIIRRMEIGQTEKRPCMHFLSCISQQVLEIRSQNTAKGFDYLTGAESF